MLSVEGIEFGYQKNPPLLSDWTCHFSSGELTAITGPSGRGKSTLLYLLGLMLTPRSGEVRLGTTVVSALSDRERALLRAEHYGFVFQDAALDPTRSVLDNVIEGALYRGTRRADETTRAISLMEQFGVLLRADARPTQVSGGQAQRIALCRALLHQPAVVLADEPTGNLDPETRDLVVDALRNQARGGSTVIVVTHDSAVADRCDRNIRL